MSASTRGEWSSQFGFVLAAAGSAIGLGNIWRFPYSAGENGGGAFVLVYLICVVALGLPVMLLEISLGRFTQKNPVGAIKALRPKGAWTLLGYLAILTGVGILSCYAVIAGQVLIFFLDFVQRPITGVALGGLGPFAIVLALAAFLALTAAVVSGGVRMGIERWAKILMPVLLVLMVVVIIRGLFLPGASEGLRWLLMPDFSKLTIEVILDAVAQAFFSLSLGMGGMLTYGSYLSKKQDMLHCCAWVVIFDTLIAIMAGLMIFPALFALGEDPAGGPPLIFNVLPAVFSSMPGGVYFGAGFFFLLGVAALTSTVSLLEVVCAYFIDELGWTRRRTVWTAAAATFVVGIPSALAWVKLTPWATCKILGQTGFDGLMSFLFVELSLPIGALLLCFFVTYVWRLDNAVAEVSCSSPGFARVAPIWRFFVRWVCPIVITLILISKLL